MDSAAGNGGPMRRLVIRPGAIGDFIVSLPAIECLRGGYLEEIGRAHV